MNLELAIYYFFLINKFILLTSIIGSLIVNDFELSIKDSLG